MAAASDTKTYTLSQIQKGFPGVREKVLLLALSLGLRMEGEVAKNVIVTMKDVSVRGFNALIPVHVMTPTASIRSFPGTEDDVRQRTAVGPEHVADLAQKRGTVYVLRDGTGQEAARAWTVTTKHNDCVLVSERGHAVYIDGTNRDTGPWVPREAGAAR